jgi:biopolymer transport protein ExbB
MEASLPLIIILVILGGLGIYSFMQRDRFKSQWLSLTFMIVGGIAIFLLVSIIIVEIIVWTYAQLEELSKDKPLMNTIVRGGAIVLVLYFLLILVLAFTIERIYSIAIARGRGSKEHLMKDVMPLLESKRYDEAMTVCIRHHGAAGRLIGAIVTRYMMLAGKTDEKTLRREINTASDETNAMEQALIERNLIGIATIGSIANLLGLLGTVIGMIRSFSAMSFGQVTKATHIQLATGISQALVCAAGGLVVAILAVVFYNYFTARVDRFNSQLNEVASETLRILKSK